MLLASFFPLTLFSPWSVVEVLNFSFVQTCSFLVNLDTSVLRFHGALFYHCCPVVYFSLSLTPVQCTPLLMMMMLALCAPKLDPQC